MMMILFHMSNLTVLEVHNENLFCRWISISWDTRHRGNGCLAHPEQQHVKFHASSKSRDPIRNLG